MITRLHTHKNQDYESIIIEKKGEKKKEQLVLQFMIYERDV